MLYPDTDTPTRPANAQDSAFLEEKAFRARTVLVFGTVTDALAAETVRKLLALDAEARAPITMIVSSPGGHLESGDAIHDVVRFVASPVHMVGTGWVGSAATHLYLGAARSCMSLRCASMPALSVELSSSARRSWSCTNFDVLSAAAEVLPARDRMAAS